ncbi:FAD-dependent oxidoreductase [Leptolyngbya ohadii]|uniref:FAD-dependent oxidoreductase n=1 Tax=Leptolyngbya ohadii TaxID=1962290 RepID=UPI000B59CEEC|nr:FAD-dependent oxidoreductase [Leptolyngbya ohadii]
MTAGTPTSGTPSVTRAYDFIGFGDELPGILALVAAAREYRRRTGVFPRSLLLFKGDSQQGIGGHLVRGGLAYLDRSRVPPEIRAKYGLPDFGDGSTLYNEFLQKSGVVQVALDGRRADTVLRQMLREAGVDILSRVEIESVIREGSQIKGIRLTKGEVYLAEQFIDSTVNAELAQMAGVAKRSGFGTIGLPQSELSVSLVFETEGLDPYALKQIELEYIKRFSNPADQEAQRFLNAAVDGDRGLANLLRLELVDQFGKPRSMWIGPDYIDIPTKALSIAYHAYRGTKLSLGESFSILDNANIARLGNGRLSWNALLFWVNAEQAETLARSGAKPTAAMLTEMTFIDRWFKSLGATRVRSMPELYIRHAGNITDVVQPLSGTQMLFGGIPSAEALGTFGYHFDIRGGIDGYKERAEEKGIKQIYFQPPLFNVGMRHAIVKSLSNLAVISPGSGFTGLASSAGRIVEFNAGVGQAIGIAAAIALLSKRPLTQIANSEVRSVLSQTGRLPRIYPLVFPEEAAQLQKLERALAP